MSSEDLLTRVRAEYAELPGLRLTLAQACRLWQLERSTCESLMQHLVRDRFLTRSRDGVFMMLPPERPKAAKASLRTAGKRQRA